MKNLRRLIKNKLKFQKDFKNSGGIQFSENFERFQDKIQNFWKRDKYSKDLRGNIGKIINKFRNKFEKLEILSFFTKCL